MNFALFFNTNIRSELRGSEKIVSLSVFSAWQLNLILKFYSCIPFGHRERFFKLFVINKLIKRVLETKKHGSG